MMMVVLMVMMVLMVDHRVGRPLSRDGRWVRSFHPRSRTIMLGGRSQSWSCWCVRCLCHS